MWTIAKWSNVYVFPVLLLLHPPPPPYLSVLRVNLVFIFLLFSVSSLIFAELNKDLSILCVSVCACVCEAAWGGVGEWDMQGVSWRRKTRKPRFKNKLFYNPKLHFVQCIHHWHNFVLFFHMTPWSLFNLCITDFRQP